MDLEKFKQMLTDNRLENLRILCPNCHSQTETYCGAKKRKNSGESIIVNIAVKKRKQILNFVLNVFVLYIPQKKK